MATGKICAATGNEEKLRRLRKALRGSGIRVYQRPLDLPELRSDNVVCVAAHKVLFAFERLREPCVVLDSGFFIRALNDFPKTSVKLAISTIGPKGILTLVEGRNRLCEFRHCLAYFDGAQMRFFTSTSPGTIASQLQGKKSSWALHRIFIPKGECTAIAAMKRGQRLAWERRRDQSYYITKFARWMVRRAKAP